MKSFEIFSGAGGLAKGLEMAGFEHLSFVESNKHACNSLRQNFDPSKVYEGDIATYDLTNLSAIDLVAGGPPCQPFSLGGKHKSHQDNRDMFPYAIKCIEALKPKAFLFENVRGLLRSSFSSYFEYILLRLTYPQVTLHPCEEWSEHLTRLKRLNPTNDNGVLYRVQYKLLQAADYGVPQKRERVVIVGFRSDIHASWTFPEPTHSEDRLAWDQFVTGEYWERHRLPKKTDEITASKLYQRYGFLPPPQQAWKTIRDALSDIPHPLEDHCIQDHLFRKGARTYPGHSGSDIDQPSKTIKAGDHGVPGGENMLRYEDDSVRYFTVHEAKLLQTFPCDFRFSGAWSEAMRQIGNAVPVRLAEILGKHLVLFLQKSSLKKEDVKQHPFRTEVRL